MAILFFLISSAISTDIGLTVLHYQSQHSFSLFVYIRKKVRFFPQISVSSQFNLPFFYFFFFFLLKGSKFLWRLLGRHLQVQNRHLITPFRSPSLTVNFIEMCAHLWILCSQFQTSSLMGCSFLL